MQFVILTDKKKRGVILIIHDQKINNNQPETKKDIKRIEKSLRKFVTKADSRNLRSELLKIEVRVKNIEEKAKKVDEKLERLTVLESH